VPHAPLNVAELGCDFLAFSAHKMLGPTGVGVLYGRTEVLDRMDPFLGGGEMIREVWEDRATYNDAPARFEAGTPNIADVVAFEAALAYLEGLGMAEVRAHEKRLTAHALARFAELTDVRLYGPRDPELRGGVISFNMSGVHPHDVGTVLDRQGIAIRAGHHCAQPLMKRYGISGTCRASFYVYTTEEETDRLVQALHEVREIFAPAPALSTGIQASR
jgi:cysteine desulfurase/selenocysteine lyase